MSLGLEVARVAPLYNLAMVAIVVALFIKLFRTHVKNKAVFMLPWKLIFFAVLVFIVEEIITVLRQIGLIRITAHINGFFELAIIILFIYALLVQKEFVKKHYSIRRPVTRTVKKKPQKRAKKKKRRK